MEKIIFTPDKEKTLRSKGEVEGFFGNFENPYMKAVGKKLLASFFFEEPTVSQLDEVGKAAVAEHETAFPEECEIFPPESGTLVEAMVLFENTFGKNRFLPEPWRPAIFYNHPGNKSWYLIYYDEDTWSVAFNKESHFS